VGSQRPLWLGSRFLVQQCLALFGETIGNEGECLSGLPDRTQDGENLQREARIPGENLPSQHGGKRHERGAMVETDEHVISCSRLSRGAASAGVRRHGNLPGANLA
jgi:hypothetical protein